MISYPNLLQKGKFKNYKVVLILQPNDLSRSRTEFLMNSKDCIRYYRSTMFQLFTMSTYVCIYESRSILDAL